MSSVCSQDVHPRTMTSHTAFCAPAGWRAQAWRGMCMLVWFIFRCRSFFLFLQAARTRAGLEHAQVAPVGLGRVLLTALRPVFGWRGTGRPRDGWKARLKGEASREGGLCGCKGFCSRLVRAVPGT